MGYPIQFISTGDPLVEAITIAVEEAARSFHDVNSWDDNYYNGPESPKSRIEDAAHAAADAIEKMRTELTHLRAKAAAGAKLREALPVVTPRYCRECSADSALEEMNDAAAEYDAAVGEGGG